MCPWQVGPGLQGPKIDDLCALHKHKLSTSLSQNAGERERDRDRERTYIPGSDPKIDDHHFRNLNLDLVRGKKRVQCQCHKQLFCTHKDFLFFCCFSFTFSTFTPRMLRSKYNHKHGQDYSTAATRGTVKNDVFLSSILPPLCQKMQNVCCQTNHREICRGKTKTILFWPGALDIDFFDLGSHGNFRTEFLLKGY